jgi:hypothetical protein
MSPKVCTTKFLAHFGSKYGEILGIGKTSVWVIMCNQMSNAILEVLRRRGVGIKLLGFWRNYRCWRWAS